MSNNAVSRRSMLKAAAWSIPVVSLAISAPAYAASTPSKDAVVNIDTFAQDGVTAKWSESGQPITEFKGRLNFRPNWDSAAVTNAVLVIEVPIAGIDTGSDPVISGAGWTYASIQVSSGVVRYTFNFTGSVARNVTSDTLSFVLPGDGTTPKNEATPKTASAYLSGSQFETVIKQVIWR